MNAAKIDITNYTDGDAKWFFDPVYITPGKEYTISNYSKSNVTTRLIADYTFGDASHSYVEIGQVPASATWRKNEFVIVPPAGAMVISVFHSLEKVGSLTVDNYSLTLVQAPPPPPPPPPPVANLIANPSAETQSTTTPTLPYLWSNGKWGTNTTTFTYGAPGFDGTKAMKVQMTSYTSGDAKWFFKDVPVQTGKTYTYSEWYTATVPTTIVARYTLSNQTFQYVNLAANVIEESLKYSINRAHQKHGLPFLAIVAHVHQRSQVNFE